MCGGHATEFFEQDIEVTGIGNANLIADLIQLTIGVAKEILGPFNPDSGDILIHCDMGVFLKQCAEIILGKFYVICKIPYRQLGIAIVSVNI